MAISFTKKQTSLASKTIKNISNILLNRTTTKRNLSNIILGYKKKREQEERRQQLQDELSAVLRVSRPGGSRSLSLSQSGDSFISRIVGFIGYVSSGWLLSNMPTWISGANELSKRITSLNSTFTSFIDNVGELMADIGRLSNAFYQNMISFDLTDSNYRIRNSLFDLNDTLQSMGNQVTEAFNVLTEPFTNLPPLGSEGEEGAYPRIQPESEVPSGRVTGGNPDFWLLSLISSYESLNPQGGADVAQSIYNRMKYSGRSARQEILSKNQYEPVGKFGRTSEWNKVVDRETAIAHIKKYPGNGVSTDKLDKVASALTNTSMQQSAAKFVGNRPDFRSQGYEKQYNDITDDTTRNGQTFGFNRGSSYKGKSTVAANIPDFIGIPSSETAKPTPAQVSQIPTTVIDEVNVAAGGIPTVGRSGGRGEYLAIREGKIHKGIDIGTSGEKGYYVAFKMSGTITYAGWNDGGFGNLVIIKSGNLEFFFAHLAKIMVKNGSPYNGETIGEIGNTGRSSNVHLHFEVRTLDGKHTNPEPYLKYLSIGKKFTSIVSKPKPSTPLVPAPPSSTVSTSIQTPEGSANIDSDSRSLLDELLSNITTERKGRQIVFINDIKPSTQRSTLMSSGGESQIIPIDESELISNFIKNKLLLDLNYL